MTMQLPIKAVGVVILIAVPILLLRVGHKNPQLITSLFNQSASSKVLPQRDSLELRANQCGIEMKSVVKMTDKQLNDLVFECSRQRK
jgi:hypothetical protein